MLVSEYYFTPSNFEQGLMLHTCPHKIKRILENFKYKYKYLKPQESFIKQYIKDNIVYEMQVKSDQTIHDIKTYTKKVVGVNNNCNGCVCVKSEKHKLPAHAFPSSCDIDSITYISRSIYRKSNKIYINVEYHQPVKKDPFWKFYINVNFEENDDYNVINMELHPIISDIQQYV
jgi:hypothetical protein